MADGAVVIVLDDSSLDSDNDRTIATARKRLPAARSRLKLSLENRRLLIVAPSRDTLLERIPGSGWQPSSRAWEFDNHPGIVYIALDVLGTDLGVSRDLRAQSKDWRAQVDASPRSRSLFEERNDRYFLHHGKRHPQQADLIPTRRDDNGGSRFNKHAAIFALLERLFRASDSTISGPTLSTPRPKRSRKGSAPGKGKRHTREPELPKVDIVEQILEQPTNFTPKQIAAQLPQLRKRDETRTAAAASAALNSIGSPVSSGPLVPLTDFLLEVSGLADEESWPEACANFLSAAVEGRVQWLPILGANGVKAFTRERDKASLILALMLTERGPANSGLRKWSALFDALEWRQRIDLVVALPSRFDLDPSLVNLTKKIAGVVAERLGRDRMPSGQTLLDLLDILEHDPATYRAALDAFRHDTLFVRDIRASDVSDFLIQAVDQLSEINDPINFELAFDDCISFLLTEGKYPEAVQVSAKYIPKLSVKAPLALAFARVSEVGNSVVAQELLDSFLHTGDVPRRNLLLAEAKWYGASDPELLEKCERADPTPIERPRLRGTVLIVGGHDHFGARIRKVLRRSNTSELRYTWKSAREALNSKMIGDLVRSHRNVLLHSWVIAHSASGNVKDAAKRCRANLRISSMPGISAVVEDLIALLSGRKTK